MPIFTAVTGFMFRLGMLVFGIEQLTERVLFRQIIASFTIRDYRRQFCKAQRRHPAGKSNPGCRRDGGAT